MDPTVNEVLLQIAQKQIAKMNKKGLRWYWVTLLAVCIFLFGYSSGIAITKRWASPALSFGINDADNLWYKIRVDGSGHVIAVCSPAAKGG